MSGYRREGVVRRPSVGIACLVLTALFPALALSRPSVAITSPADQAVVSGQAWINVAFRSDNFRQIVRLEFQLDGQEPQGYVLPVPMNQGQKSFPLDTSALQPGPHVLAVKAYDSAGEAADTRLTINVGGLGAQPGTQYDRIPPAVSIYYPAQGATVSGRVSIRAEASDQGGIRNVIFFIDGKLHTMRMNAPPYNAEWDTARYSDGPHVVEA